MYPAKRKENFDYEINFRNNLQLKIVKNSHVDRLYVNLCPALVLVTSMEVHPEYKTLFIFMNDEIENEKIQHFREILTKSLSAQM